MMRTLTFVILFCFLAGNFLVLPSFAQPSRVIDTQVTDALKREFKANYGYEWEEASDKIQVKFFQQYNLRTRKERELERHRQQQAVQDDRRKQQISKNEDRQLEMLKRQREREKLLEVRNKRLKKRQLADKMKIEMRKLTELRKKAKQTQKR